MKGCPISPFHFKFPVDDVIKTDLSEVHADDVLLPGAKHFDPKYADDIVLLWDNTQAIRISLN